MTDGPRTTLHPMLLHDIQTVPSLSASQAAVNMHDLQTTSAFREKYMSVDVDLYLNIPDTIQHGTHIDPGAPTTPLPQLLSPVDISQPSPGKTSRIKRAGILRAKQSESNRANPQEQNADARRPGSPSPSPSPREAYAAIVEKLKEKSLLSSRKFSGDGIRDSGNNKRKPVEEADIPSPLAKDAHPSSTFPRFKIPKLEPQ